MKLSAIPAIAVTSLLLGSPGIHAASLTVVITNLTPGQAISPPVVALHNAPLEIAGKSATAGLELLAEDGGTSTLLDGLEASPNVGGAAAAAGPIPPGGSISVDVSAESEFEYLSVVGMLVNTNDTFFAVLNQPVNEESESGTAYGEGWDAGTEVNTESCDDIPGPACGGGTGSEDEDGFIHVSNGIHGTGDLTPGLHDWRNPVVRVVFAPSEE